MEAIGVVNQSQYDARSVLGQEDLFKILLAQLSYQDPLKPMDNQEFMSQIARFSSLDQQRQVNEKLDFLMTSQSAAQSIGLIGRSVDISLESGLDQGTVSAIEFSQGTPLLTVRRTDGTYVTAVSLSRIIGVR